MTDIILTTLNARYMHSAFGLRYLFANLGDVQERSEMIEFTIQDRPMDVVEKLLEKEPKIVSFGVYIWNVNELTETISLLRLALPEVIIIIGGPEVSHPPDLPSLATYADYIVTGPGELSLPKLCADLLADKPPTDKIIVGETAELKTLKLPYDLYNEDDIRNRMIYVEASRGCPFKCEFCLSSLDKTSKPFELSCFLVEMDKLYQRGARNFKFIDRTFNLKVSTSVTILEFFLERMTDDLYLHFEVIPDNLPEKLRETLKRFPPNSLQFEIGIQTFDPDIQSLISRKQNNEKSCDNIRWLRENTGAHLHVDLIFGLPSDNLENFGKSFDKLVALNPQEIQMGILKRLRGAPINRHTEEYELKYNPRAPYNILSTRDIDFVTLQRMNRFARFWDMIANSGRFPNTLEIILADQPFTRFYQLSDALYRSANSTWKISLKRLYRFLYSQMIECLKIKPEEARRVLELDHIRSGQKDMPDLIVPALKAVGKTGVANKRQLNHQ